jgi:mRNA-degrading endonuclease RelE of RelBE toxin-antitoxin system
MSYVLRIDKQAAKTLRALDQTTIRRIHARLQELSQNPFDPRTSSPLEMEPALHKSRVGNWRIFFEVDLTTGTVSIVAIKPRSRAYR